MLRSFDDICDFCSRPGWDVYHEIYAGKPVDHGQRNHWIDNRQIKAMQQRYPGVKRRDLYAIITESTRDEVYAA